MNQSNVPDDLAGYWAEIQESLSDALVQYHRVHPEMIELMKENDYFNAMNRNVFANGSVRENMAAAKAKGKHEASELRSRRDF